MNYKENQARLIEQLQGLTTAENAETVGAMTQIIEAMAKEHDEAVKEGLNAKNALVKAVTGTGFRHIEADAIPTHEDAPKSIDDLIDDSLGEIVAKRGRK